MEIIRDKKECFHCFIRYGTISEQMIKCHLCNKKFSLENHNCNDINYKCYDQLECKHCFVNDTDQKYRYLSCHLCDREPSLDKHNCKKECNHCYYNNYETEQMICHLCDDIYPHKFYTYNFTSSCECD